MAKKNPQFFEDLKEDLKYVEYFEFTGGEPFMIKDHFKILMHCVEKGICQEHRHPLQHERHTATTTGDI